MRSSSTLRSGQVATRRQILASSLALGSLLIASCAQQALPAATAAPVVPTNPPAPTAAATAASAPAPTQTIQSAPANTPTTAPQAAAATPTAQPAAQAAPQAVAGAPVVPLFRSSANELPFLNSDIALFTKNNPTITINPIFVPGNQYNQKTDLMVASGDPPSLWFPASDRGFKYYSSKGLVMDLSSFIKRDNYSLDDFFPRGVLGSTWKGTQQAIPISEWAWVLYYNKTLFDQAKIAYPPQDWKDTSWTWDKYLETAKALSVIQNGKATQFGTNIPEGRSLWTGWTHGGWWFNKDWDTTGWITQFTAPNDPTVAEALQYWADAANKLHIAPTAAEEQSAMSGAPNLFMSGKIAMSLDSLGVLSEQSKITQFDWGIAARPRPTKAPSHTGVWVDEWSMFAQVRNPDGSWEFMKHMVSPDGEKIYPMAYGPIGSRQSLGPSWLDTWKTKIPKVADQLSVAVNAVPLEFVTPDNFTVNLSPINDQGIQPEIDKLFLGQQSATDAIKAMVPKVQKLIADTSKGAS
jgi:multiple sugar transport system substrate-binding protein